MEQNLHIASLTITIDRSRTFDKYKLMAQVEQTISTPFWNKANKLIPFLLELFALLGQFNIAETLTILGNVHFNLVSKINKHQAGIYAHTLWIDCPFWHRSKRP